MDRVTGKQIPGKSVKYDKRDRMEVSGGQWIGDEIFAYNTFVEDGKRRPGYNGDIFLLHMDKNVNERIWHWKGVYAKRVSKSGGIIRGALNIISTLPDDEDNVLVSNRPYLRKDGGVRPIIYKMNISTLNFDKVLLELNTKVFFTPSKITSPSQTFPSLSLFFEFISDVHEPTSLQCPS